jgi:hypothetical protein
MAVRERNFIIAIGLSTFNRLLDQTSGTADRAAHGLLTIHAKDLSLRKTEHFPRGPIDIKNLLVETDGNHPLLEGVKDVGRTQCIKNMSPNIRDRRGIVNGSLPRGMERKRNH